MQTWTNKHGANLGAGPWEGEPDKAVWVDKATDLDCMIHRNRTGALCGYVGVGPDHSLHGKDYDKVGVDVHGGLTYANGCQEGDDPAINVCHVPQPGRPDDVWWFGFDCAHFRDLVPGMAAMPELVGIFNDAVYRDFVFVTAEVESLAKQLKGSL